MDEYDKKFAEMQKYIPFLEAMIERLQNVKDKSREVQLQKMQSLHGILSNSKRKLKIETLQRCEDVLQKLHNKVEKGNTPGLHFPSKRNDGSSTQSSTEAENAEQSRSKVPQVDDKGQKKKINETPASPTPPVSPDSGSQVAPIIIPTERSTDFVDDSKPASPDPVDTLPTKAPIIIPTERTSNDITLSSPSSQRDPGKSIEDVSFTEWDMLEENENQAARNKNWQSTDVKAAIKLVGSNLSQKISDVRPLGSMHTSRHIPTVAVPTLGSSRRISTMLEKARMLTKDASPADRRSASPANAPDARLKSPDPEILFSKPKNASPRLKESIPRPATKPPAPLLLSPPPVSEPPLSMEDLAELLSEETDDKTEDEKSKDEGKAKKDKQDASKDPKASKSTALAQKDVDTDSEKRSEEIDRQLIKLPSRKVLLPTPPTPLATKTDTLKPNETKGPPVSLMHNSSTFPLNAEKPVVENRNRPPSPGSKTEPRYADNYERHPRQQREGHIHDNIKDKSNLIFCRPSEEEMFGPVPVPPVLHGGPGIEDRNPAMYTRRQGNVPPEIPPRIETQEFRMEGPEYFNRQMPNQAPLWPPMPHAPVNANEFAQWPPAPNFSGIPNATPQPYQHPMGMHQEMWNMAPTREPLLMPPAREPLLMDPPLPINEPHRPNPFPATMTTGIRPLISPTARPQDLNHIPRPDELPPIDGPSLSTIQPLVSPTRFPVGPQIRNFQGETRPYEQPFDRGMEYLHQRQSWDAQAARPNEVAYRPENEVPCGVKGPTDAARPFPRPSTPCPWSRDRSDRGGGRGRSTYYNERNRTEGRGAFNRDARRNDWPRDAHNEWDNSNRFSRDNRNISERDPRVREHNAANQPANPPKEASPSARDPRLARDKHISPKGKETFSERDPRKRSTGSAFSQTFKKTKEKPKSPPKVPDSHKPENIKQQDKVLKDKMQSPLESLYGVIDTKAKIAQGYNLQKFKIPKIKRNESSESPTSSHNPEEFKTPECVDKEGSKSGKDKEDTTAEVSSSSDGNLILDEEDWNEGGGIICEKKDEEPKEDYIFPEPVEEKSDPVVEPDQITTTSPKSSSSAEKKEMEPEGSKPKEEVTQEWIEALIRKSFEVGEGKKFVEQAKFMQKLGEVLKAKKMKKIKKIIESESESSNSEKEDTLETKKLRVRKKRRVIRSDSSDDESLAERLGIMSTGGKRTNDSSAENKTPKVGKSSEESGPNESTFDPADVSASKTKRNVPEGDARIEPPSGVRVDPNSEELRNPETAEKPEAVATDAQEESRNDESAEVKDSANKTPKAKTKRRNSLEMLQEDIREMFISNDVVSATGHRQCRAQKEVQQNSSSAPPSQTTPSAKKEEPSKRCPEATSDTEEPGLTSSSAKSKKPPKSRPAEEPSKKGKSKKEASRVTRQRTKQVDQSSDSEEDQPLALRTELAQRGNAADDQDANLDEPERRRRSKRIINKETIKEPRVLVEKTDISKLECSKVMFDSSSDESFGIDVSELAAAVDVSLHPDKQSEPETSEPTEKKKAGSSKKAKKKPGVELTEIKGEELILTDEESIISNLSMTSSVAFGKKAAPLAAKADISGNEELLSNILIGITPVKMETIKVEPLAEKGSDADVDEDLANDHSTETSTKKSLGKKKKKKWQMGILSKKKKKRTATTPKDDSDAKNAGADGKSTVDEDKDEENSLYSTTNESISEQLDDSRSSQHRRRETSNEKENASTVKRSKDSSKSPAKEDDSAATTETSKNAKSKTKANKLFNNLDINILMNYAWTGQERYNCLLCTFTGKNIVHHYKMSHAGREILISRLNPEDAQLAIRDAKMNDVENASLRPSNEETCKFTCRICTFITEGAAKVAVEAFYEHWTTHTGEYRFRCNGCLYHAVAKSSMKTHYYKVCRKFKDTFNEAITEDEIPDENRVYGYLCSSCNFIQLKRSNLEEHMELWHKGDSKAEIIKINMSLNEVKSEPVNVSVGGAVKVEVPQVDTDNLEESVSDAVASQNDEGVTGIESIKNAEPMDVEEEKKDIEIKENVLPEDTSGKEDSAEVEPEGTKKKKTTEGEGDSSLPTGNLSVFVCPPELEKNEVEIQLERKRKMQEIVQNIGIKIQKDAAKKGLSIIDKLQDKMKPNVEGDENDSDATPKSPSRVTTNPTSLTRPESTELLSSTPLPTVEVFDTSLPLSEEALDDKQSDCSTIKLDPLSTTEAEDPLAIVDQKKNDESEGETSDNENARSSTRIYESDSSSEQSDAELSTDVNMILKETSTINASSKDPMLTTIQRLAAQLQATKPIESADDSSVKSGEATDRSDADLPKPPDVVPINSIKEFVGKLNKFHEIVPENNDDSNPPKNFIRLRRLSGDMLSVSTPPPSTQEEAQTPKNDEPSTPTKMDSAPEHSGEEECSFLKIENVVSLAPSAASGTESPIINDIRKAVETSTVKGKGGMSLLKKSHSPLILKRLNTVTIAQPLTKNIPIQSKTIQSSPPEMVKLIPVKNLSPSPVSVAAAQIATNFIPIAPKSKIIQVDNKLSFPLAGKTTVAVTPVTTRTVTVGGSSQAPNYKIVKVVRAPILKTKDNPIIPSLAAIKLKSMDVYNAMLKPAKLTHLYKCMGRDCMFTTDILEQYHQHYNTHLATSKRYKKGPFDFQKCAYCYMALKNWTQMKLHLNEKHAHCRYQCSYCFYRAISISYVRIHQAISHPGLHDILLGKLVKDMPTKEEIDRQEVVHPFICQYADCGQFFYVPESFAVHLKSKHGELMSALKCHVCHTSFVNADQLLMHYKVHGFYKYQCVYCLSGTESLTEMHRHLSVFHCNRLPQTLERSLPLQTQLNKDVIDQLIIRSMDDSFKVSDIDTVINDGKTTKDSTPVDPETTSQQSQKTPYSQLPKDVNMLDKDENEALNKSLSSLFGNNSSSSSSTQQESTPAKSSDGSVTSTSFKIIKTDPDSSMASALNKESTNKNLSDLHDKVTSFLFDKNPLEPLELPAGTFDCSDEFININLLDNPDFLMNVNSRSSNMSFVSNENESKADDSDIEIVDIINSYSSSTKDEKSKTGTNKKDSLVEKVEKVDKEEKEEKVEKVEEVDTPSQESDTKEQSSSDVEHSNAPTEISGTSGTSTSTTKPDKPLTLDDIKHTGFQGTKLYKCGYETCDFGAQTPSLLRSHSRECALGGPDKQMNCFHCHKRFLKIGFLLEHLKVHGLKRFGCALCKVRRTVGHQVMAHMKTKHKVNNCKLVPADPKNPSVDGLFVVQPVYQVGERKGKKRKSTKSFFEKELERGVVMDTEKLSFSPDEIESLPRQAIYNREVQCAMCPYTTKVRTNIIRHLQLHAKDESVPESGPVNPVPCLDKKERMFDKMVNLASSSHQNGRMGGKQKETPKDNEDEFIPKFVPEHKRYVCGVAECNYLTVDEAMLRCHLKALHSEEQYFRCPHCPQPPPGQEGLNIAIDKMAVHLKMHDTRLYKCSHCNHHHYHRHIVERHLTDKHPEKRPFVKVIRESENTENNQSVQEEVEEELPDPDGNHWKCNICEYKCVYKAEMVTHAASAHDEKNQFKCTLCSFKTSGKIMFEQHINNKHSNDPSVDFIMVYQRIKGINKRNVDNIDQTGQEEPFDTTPLWRRDMPRIRHIRGILLEEENETSSESPLKATKRKSDVELPAIKPAKIKPGKSGSLDDAKQTKEKCKRSLSFDKASMESENSCEASNVADKMKETKVNGDEDNDFNDSDVGRFGPYGRPDGNMYVCTLCVQFKSKYKHDMRDHLYRELNYARWHCKDCGYLSVNRNALLKHFTKHHYGERPNHEPLSPDDDIEHWVGTLLTRQTRMIKGLPPTENASSTDVTTTASGNSTKTSVAKPYQTSGRKTSRSASLANKASVSQDSKIPSSDFDVDALDDSSKDNEGLMDTDDFSFKTEESPTGSEKLERKQFREKPVVCKHCNLTFTRWRGFKLHVLLTHLKRLGFICPYCDRSTNSEALMRQHIRSKHPGCPEKLVENPAAGGPELTDQFWEKEYGIVFPRRSKKRKRKPSEENTDENDQTEKKCSICGFVALNLAGLKGHMRVHRPRSKFKCFSCSFVTFSKSDFWSHWEMNHPFTPFKLDDALLPDSSSESGTTQSNKKNMDDDYSDDIEEEQVSDSKDELISDSKDDRLLYSCFYCSFHNKSLDMIQDHWNTVHKDSKSSGDASKAKSNYPFRYKEVHLTEDSPKAQCSKTEMETPYELYLQQSNSDPQSMDMSGVTQEGWICQWCNELCDSEVTMKNHHSMFHSHLPLNFKKQEKNKVPKGYVCPECSFTTTFINVMKNHVSRHINLFKCKYCDKTFGSPALVSTHTVEAHPKMELKIESIHNYEALLESIMAKVKWQKSDMDSSDVDQKDGLAESLKNHAVAKKSTAKSTVRPSQVSVKVKAVARKSTNPYSRHLSQSRMNEEQASSTSSKQFSYYRIPRTPVNLGKLNTYMVVGGHRMKVNCTTLARLINIEPKVMLRDLKYTDDIAKLKSK